MSFTADGTRPVSGRRASNNSFPTDMAPNTRYAISLMPLMIPCGAMRAPATMSRCSWPQSFLHELSLAAGRDHVEFLLEWLTAAGACRGPWSRRSGPQLQSRPRRRCAETGGAKSGLGQETCRRQRAWYRLQLRLWRPCRPSGGIERRRQQAHHGAQDHGGGRYRSGDQHERRRKPVPGRRH